MSHASKPAIVLISIAICTLTAGCSGDSRPEGHYEGSLLQRLPDHVDQKPVSEDISYDRSGETGKIEVRDVSHALLATLQMTDIHGDRFTIEIPGANAPVTLIKKDGNCFESRDASGATLCFDSQKFTLELSGDQNRPVYALTGDHFAPAMPPELETARQYTLSGAVAEAMQKNFDTRIQYDQMIEAKHVANAAYLQLLPHLSFSDVLSNLPPTLTSIIGAIGDLVPFLFPSNWFYAQEQALQADLQKQTVTLMRADLATQIEGLTYSLARDEGILAAYDLLLPKVQQALAQTRALEAQEEMPEGSVLHIEAVLNFMQLDMNALELLIEQDKAAIAQALGLNNPRAVIEVAIDSETLPIDQATPLDPVQLGNLASGRSLELAQMDTTIGVARLDQRVGQFGWLDPSGTNGGGSNGISGLGFYIGETLAANRESMDQLLLRRQQLQAALLQKADSAAARYNDALASYGLAKDGLAIEEQRVAFVTSEIHAGSPVNTLDYESVIQDFLNASMRMQTLLTEFRVARSNVDRMLLQGYYQRVPLPTLP